MHDTPHAAVRDPASVPHLPLFFASLTWNYGLGMSYVVVPLYAHAQGLSGLEIGTLFSIPVLFQMSFNLVGGAYTDRIGGRRIMLASCWLITLGAAGFVFAHGFWPLFCCQVLMVLSRSAFWPSAWTLASELPGERSTQLGRLNALTNVGQIAGTASAGFILALAGFTASFVTLAAMGVVSWLVALPLREAARKPHKPGSSVFAAYASLMRMRVIYYSVMCAYLSALPFSLSMSFYPLLLKDYGYSAETSGILIALRAVGSIAAGLVAARFVKTGPASLAPIIAGIAVALSVGLLPAINHPLSISLLMLVVGLGSGIMTLYFQITMSEVTGPAERGSALALGGLGWGVSHLTTPLVMGFFADRIGLVAGFYALGAFAFAWAIFLATLRPWAFAHTRHSKSAG